MTIEELFQDEERGFLQIPLPSPFLGARTRAWKYYSFTVNYSFDENIIPPNTSKQEDVFVICIPDSMFPLGSGKNTFFKLKRNVHLSAKQQFSSDCFWQEVRVPVQLNGLQLHPHRMVYVKSAKRKWVPNGRQQPSPRTTQQPKISVSCPTNSSLQNIEIFPFESDESFVNLTPISPVDAVPEEIANMRRNGGTFFIVTPHLFSLSCPTPQNQSRVLYAVGTLFSFTPENNQWQVRTVWGTQSDSDTDLLNTVNLVGGNAAATCVWGWQQGHHNLSTGLVALWLRDETTVEIVHYEVKNPVVDSAILPSQPTLPKMLVHPDTATLYMFPGKMNIHKTFPSSSSPSLPRYSLSPQNIVVSPKQLGQLHHQTHLLKSLTSYDEKLDLVIAIPLPLVDDRSCRVLCAHFHTPHAGWPPPLSPPILSSPVVADGAENNRNQNAAEHHCTTLKAAEGHRSSAPSDPSSPFSSSVPLASFPSPPALGDIHDLTRCGYGIVASHLSPRPALLLTHTHTPPTQQQQAEGQTKNAHSFIPDTTTLLFLDTMTHCSLDALAAFPAAHRRAIYGACVGKYYSSLVVVDAAGTRPRTPSTFPLPHTHTYFSSSPLPAANSSSPFAHTLTPTSLSLPSSPTTSSSALSSLYFSSSLPFSSVHWPQLSPAAHFASANPTPTLTPTPHLFLCIVSGRNTSLPHHQATCCFYKVQPLGNTEEEAGIVRIDTLQRICLKQIVKQHGPSALSLTRTSTSEEENGADAQTVSSLARFEKSYTSFIKQYAWVRAW
eukprot:GCRY01002914.1.p1 GENE.GCRY01002914.1~~GCRY01002914.1.p1  ORF type:complete len:775 (+),score=169.16 GCRY01002914.1:181-2505(+)